VIVILLPDHRRHQHLIPCRLLAFRQQPDNALEAAGAGWSGEVQNS
jgi:hypothetical protein